MSLGRRRAVSVRLTRWLSERGSDRRHVVVRFETAEEGTVFVGGLPFEALPHSDNGLRYASVICCVASDRDEYFRDGLAAEIADALGMTSGTPLLYVEFRPTPRNQVRFGVGGLLHRPDMLA